MVRTMKHLMQINIPFFSEVCMMTHFFQKEICHISLLLFSDAEQTLRVHGKVVS